MIMKKTRLGLSILSSFLLLAVACRHQAPTWRGTTEEVDGVTIVKNPKEPLYPEGALVMEEELSIGEAEGRDEYMFSELRKVAVDSRGTIYALDMKASNVKVYDDRGVYLQTIGKRGEGPGEFQMPMWALISPKDELIVLERTRISYFALDGGFLRSVNPSAQGIAQINFDRSGNVVGMHIVMAGENPRYELGTFGPTFELLSAFDSSPIIRTANPGYNPFNSVLRWDMVRGQFAVCGYAGDGYKLKFYDLDGKLIRLVQKDYDPARVTDADIEIEMRKHGFTSREEISAPENKPPFRWIYADEEGRIFVSTWEHLPQSEGFFYDVFDPEGRYLTRVPLNGEPQAFRDGKIYLITLDKAGYQYIKRCKVTWKIQTDQR
jgi:hypothetical protein